MKLYYVPRTRAGRARWALEELGVRHELVRLDPSKGETRTPEHRARHPLGHVPVLDDDGVVLFETAAICTYLADKFADEKLAPPVGSKERGRYLQWCFFAVGELERWGGEYMLHTMRLPEAERSAARAAKCKELFDEAAGVVAGALDGKDWLLGSFTIADILVGGTLAYAATAGLLDGKPALEAYVKRLAERPARRRAYAD